MKKQFTLLAGVLLVGGSVFAQSTTITTAKAAPKKLNLNAKKGIVTTAAEDKAEGDIIFQNDFTTPSDWTITTAGQGTWVIGTAANTPDLSATAPGLNAYNLFQSFNSATETTGFAAFNGLKYLVPQNPVITPQNSSITSGVIDFTGKTVVTLSFYQLYMAFNHDDVFVDYSADGGTTWTTTIPMNTTVATNTKVTGPISVDFNSMGSANGKIRFRWVSDSSDPDFGSGYCWAIDDVVITEGAAHKANILFTHHTVGADMIKYTKFPANQVTGSEVISFGAEVLNAGGNVINASLNVSTGAYNETGAAVAITSLVTDSVAVLEADGYTIPATPGVHNFVYKVGATQDLSNSSDSTKTLNFEVTPSIMAVDSYDGTPASITGSFGNWSDQNEGDFTGIGNIFVTYKTGVIGAAQVGFDGVGSEDDYEGMPFSVTILKQDVGGAFVSVAQAEGEMQESYFGSIATIYFDEPYPVAAGEVYAVIVGSTVGSGNIGGVPVAFAGTNIQGNTVGTDDFTFASLIGLASDPATPDIVDAPVVRIDFTDYTSVKELNIEGDVTVSPNPFSDETAINFTLKTDAKVSVVITDLAGRTVMTVPASTMNAGKQSVSINGSAFKAGVYNYTLTVDGNAVTKRIVKK